MASEAESPRLTLTDQEVCQFQKRIATESICIGCTRHCQMQMVICVYCHMFSPTPEALDIIKSMLGTISA